MVWKTVPDVLKMLVSRRAWHSTDLFCHALLSETAVFEQWKNMFYSHALEYGIMGLFQGRLAGIVIPTSKLYNVLTSSDFRSPEIGFSIAFYFCNSPLPHEQTHTAPTCTQAISEFENVIQSTFHTFWAPRHGLGNISARPHTLHKKDSVHELRPCDRTKVNTHETSGKAPNALPSRS